MEINQQFVARSIAARNVIHTVPARDRLEQDCQVVVDQPRSLDRARFGNGPLTVLSAEEMGRVEKSLLAVLGLF